MSFVSIPFAVLFASLLVLLAAVRASLGRKLLLLGMSCIFFKKMVVADNVAVLVDQVYAAPAVFSSGTVWLAVFGYSVQILCDFSGYTDMAVGLGRIMGITLPPSFNLPYTAQSITECWQRWHMSLSTWLRDYLYIPLGGNRKGATRTHINLLLTMLLGGLWHGASWNFVLWGGLHGTYLTVERILRGEGKASPAGWTTARAWLKATWIFVLVSVTWIFFRSPSLEVTRIVWEKLLFFDSAGLAWWFVPAVLSVPAMVLGGFLARRWERRFPIVATWNPLLPAVLVLGAFLVFFFAALDSSPSIYCQF